MLPLILLIVLLVTKFNFFGSLDPQVLLFNSTCNCFDYLWNFVTCSFSNELHIAWKYYCTSVQTTICPLHWIDQRLNTKTAASFDRIKNQNVQKNAKITIFSRKIQTILQENNNKYIYCLVFSI